MRKATLLIADDLTYHLNGKINLLGVYSGDIVLPGPVARMNQLVFLFILESDPIDLPNVMEISVTFPSGQVIGDKFDPHGLNPDESDKIVWTLRSPLLFQGAILTPGPIKALVKYDNEDVPVSAPVIRTVAAPPPVPAAVN